MKHDPVLKVDIKINHDLGAIKALDKTQVIIHMRPEDRQKRYGVSSKYVGGIAFLGPAGLHEGLMIESGAIKTFSKIFKNIQSSRFSKVSNLVITISGKFYPYNSTRFTVKAKAVVSLASGEKLGEYDATGSSVHPLFMGSMNDENRIEFCE